MSLSSDSSQAIQSAVEPPAPDLQHPISNLQLPTSNPQPPTSTPSDRWLALLVGLAAFALYLRTLAPGLLWGDPGEFQFAAWLGGFAHPTGYPLYLILGWLWTHALPWGDPAWRMNLFSAAWGAVAVGLIYLVAVRALRWLDPWPPDEARRPTGPILSRLGALAAAAAFAVTPAFWSQAVVAEVYTLHAAFVAALLLALLIWAERPSARRPSVARARAFYGVALLSGLSLAHHRTTLLLLPALAAFLWLTCGEVHRKEGADIPRGTQPPAASTGARMPRGGCRTVLIAAALFLAPLLLYLYIPLRAPHAPYFQLALGPDQALPLYRTTFAGFLEHISGSTFSGALGGGGGLGPKLAGLAQRLLHELAWPGVLLGLIGAGQLAWAAVCPAHAGQRRSRAWLALTLLVFLATVGFNLSYGIGDIFVFYIPAYLVWALWMSRGVWACGRVGAWACGRVGVRGLPVIYLLTGLLALLPPVLLAARTFAANDRSGDVAARVAWESILAQPIPQDAILVSNDRDEMVPQWYLRYVEERRTDLDALFPFIQPDPAWSDVAAVVDQALRSGRPVYLIKPMPGLEVKFELEPVSTSPAAAIGGLVRVLGPAERGEFARSSGVTFDDRLRLAGFDIRPATAGAGQELAVVLYWEALAALDHDYTTFVHLVNAEGAVVGQSDHRPGGVYYGTSLWRTGDRLRDAHRFVVAADPGAGPYVLEVGVYRLAPDLQHLGAPQRVGEVEAGG